MGAARSDIGGAREGREGGWKNHPEVIIGGGPERYRWGSGGERGGLEAMTARGEEVVGAAGRLGIHIAVSCIHLLKGM